ncbi:DMT family transporter [Campylobacter gastrosuis]|uniref:DMT family transporter n=1 Tax=Campylobacter gastrosuis TaxID=2974576 RepID=A0ABT7HQ94_9BACT|nr:DMT family transporter [Campylobacter gastrosuis]MDL0089069.1 DMT family transporter [Campylobacter gastrosuis]
MFARLIARNLGVYYMIIASVLFATTGAFAKILSADLPSIEVVFFRNVVGLFIIIYAIFKSPLKQKGGHFWLLMFRGFIGTMALFAFFYNIAHINLGAAFTFSKTSPIFTAIIAAIVFKERLSLKGWGAIFLGFVGILFVIQPNLGISKSDWLGLFSGVGAALAYTSVKELKRSYDTRTIVLSFMAWGSALPLVFMALAENFSYEPLDFLLSPFVIPSLKNCILILLMGVAGLIFQVYLTKAYAASPKAGVVAAVSYLDVVFTIFIGFFLGDALPNHVAFFGIMLVIFSGIIVVREK